MFSKEFKQNFIIPSGGGGEFPNHFY